MPTTSRETSSSSPRNGLPQAVLILNAPGAYNALNGLISLIAREWERAAIRVIGLDLTKAGWQRSLLAAIEGHQIRLCISPGYGGRLRLKNENLWQHFRIPFFSLLVDHPVYFASRHYSLPPNVVLGYLLRDHAFYQRDHIRSANLVTSIDLGIPVLSKEPSEPVDRGKAQVIFAKTGNDPRELERKWADRPLLGCILHDIVDEVGLQNCGAYPAAVQKVSSAHRLELQPFDKLGRYLTAQIDDYIRRRKSTSMAEVIKKFPVDIYGDRWDHIERDGARARFHGGVPYPHVEGEIARSVASITMNPNVDFAAHERFYIALGAGVMPISDRNPFTKENFPHLLPYTFNFGDRSLEAALEEVFARPQRAIDTARAVRDVAAASLSTERAARQIMSCAALVEYFEFAFEPPQDFFVP